MIARFSGEWKVFLAKKDTKNHQKTLHIIKIINALYVFIRID